MTKQRALQILDDAMKVHYETCAEEDRTEIQNALNYIEINLK